MTEKNVIELEHIKKGYNEKQIIEDISLNVKEGELVSILGPSGCGKSTLLNLITGLIKPDSGTIRVDGNIGYMQQKDLLLPWKNVMKNIILPSVFQKKNPKETEERARYYLEKFGLGGYENKYPYELSGGMKQRASFLRTFLSSEEIMLLDEPFGALDSITRGSLQKWLLEIKEEFRFTILFITHDIDEAILLSDRICILTDKPSTVSGVLELDFYRENKECRLCSDESLKIRREIMQLLQGKKGCRLENGQSNIKERFRFVPGNANGFGLYKWEGIAT